MDAGDLVPETPRDNTNAKSLKGWISKKFAKEEFKVDEAAAQQEPMEATAEEILEYLNKEFDKLDEEKKLTQV